MIKMNAVQSLVVVFFIHATIQKLFNCYCGVYKFVPLARNTNEYLYCSLLGLIELCFWRPFLFFLPLLYVGVALREVLSVFPLPTLEVSSCEKSFVIFIWPMKKSNDIKHLRCQIHPYFRFLIH